MSPRLRFILAGSAILFVLKFFCARAEAQQQAGGDSLQPGHIYGEANLTTNWIEHGLTQTNKGYAMQGGFGYKWTLFKMGLWGSTFKKPGNDDNLNLRLYGSYKFVFTSNADLTARYDLNRFYPGSSQNGSIMVLDLNLFQYHLLYERQDQWEGLGAATRIGFMKDWLIPYNLIVNLNAGYDMVSGLSLANYFDFKTTLNYRWADVNYAIGHSFNTGSSQFDGRGDMAFFLQLGATF